MFCGQAARKRRAEQERFAIDVFGHYFDCGPLDHQIATCHANCCLNEQCVNF